MKRPLKIPPEQEQIQQIWDYIVARPLKKRESNRKIYECLFLLCWKTGLRITEAINFDWSFQHNKHKVLYLVRGKGKKDGWIRVNEEVIEELKKRNWQPGQGNRIMFHAWLQKIKREVQKRIKDIGEKTELEPHSLRRCFATHNAENGMPLPILQQLLRHSKITTTAIYVKDASLVNLAKYKPI